jgi:hypothetical protein
MSLYMLYMPRKVWEYSLSPVAADNVFVPQPVSRYSDRVQGWTTEPSGFNFWYGQQIFLLKSTVIWVVTPDVSEEHAFIPRTDESATLTTSKSRQASFAELVSRQEVLGRTNRLHSFDTTRTA